MRKLWLDTEYASLTNNRIANYRYSKLFGSKIIQYNKNLIVLFLFLLINLDKQQLTQVGIQFSCQKESYNISMKKNRRIENIFKKWIFLVFGKFEKHWYKFLSNFLLYQIRPKIKENVKYIKGRHVIVRIYKTVI